jgi:hypothetical protein
VPGGQDGAEVPSTVGTTPAAPPRRWPSGYMLAPRNAADSMESPADPGAYAASVVAARAATWRRIASAGSARMAGNSVRAHRAGPSAQARPARRRGGAHDPERAHLAADLGGREPGDAVQRESQRDRARRVEPSANDAARTHDHHRAAGLAHVSPEQDPEQRGRATELGRPPLVPLAQTVTVKAKKPADRTARRVAGGAPPRAHLVHPRRPRQPGLDVERCLYESNVAPVAC